VCGLAGGKLVIDRSWPTADVLADPPAAAALSGTVPRPRGRPLRLWPAVAPLPGASIVSDALARGRTGRHRWIAAADAGARRRRTPASSARRRYLDTVPEHRKINRIDLGTSDKLCAAALGIHDQAVRLGAHARDTAFVLLELGGAFTAAIAVQAGQVVDGIGGSSGPIGWQAAGALDGEVAYLAGTVDKAMLFQRASPSPPRIVAAGAGFDAFIEAQQGGAALLVSAPLAGEVWYRGGSRPIPAVRERLAAASATCQCIT
jgi:hypothetical protein